MISINYKMTDQFLVCPKCHGIPTVCIGCPQCGSSQIVPDLLVHHYACGNVDFLRTYTIDPENGVLTCPKCHKNNLIVNCDYDVSHGLKRCNECGWTGNSAKMIGQCITCKTRFLVDEAVKLEPQIYTIRIKEDHP